MLLHGIFPPVTTPFYPDGRVYFKKLEHNVERYSKTPVAGIVVLGSTGEAVMLSDEERREVLQTAREACAPQKVLIAGTGAESAIETLRLTEYAAELGYDVALVRTPHFYRPQMQPANLLAFYRTVADRSPIPILIYSVPVFTNYDMAAELVVELAGHPNIIGIKESGGDIEKIRHMAEATRQIKRSATVTETFAAVTPRMLKAAQMKDAQLDASLIPVRALAGESRGSAEQIPSAAKAATSFDPLSARLEAVPSRSSTPGLTSGSDHVGTAAPSQPALSDRPKGGSRMEPALSDRPKGGSRMGPAEPSSTAPSSSGVTVLGGLKTRQKEVGFQILAGAAHKLHASLEAGAVGAVLAFADPAPTACYEIYAAWKEGDAELARIKQERIVQASVRVGSQIGIPGMKYALDLNGYYGGPPRLPLLPLTAALKREVEQLMSDVRN